MPAYDPSNIFAKILRGEIPCEKIWEDERTFVFLDIMPRCDGHALVIPKAPARNLFDVRPDDLAAVHATAQTVARAAMRAFAADGITVQQFNEVAGGQAVFHLHVHVLPRHEGVALKPAATVMERPEVLKANAEKLRAALLQGPVA